MIPARYLYFHHTRSRRRTNFTDTIADPLFEIIARYVQE